jgi:hypothetical protein
MREFREEKVEETKGYKIDIFDNNI